MVGRRRRPAVRAGVCERPILTEHGHRLHRRNCLQKKWMALCTWMQAPRVAEGPFLGCGLWPGIPGPGSTPAASVPRQTLGGVAWQGRRPWAPSCVFRCLRRLRREMLTFWPTFTRISGVKAVDFNRSPRSRPSRHQFHTFHPPLYTLQLRPFRAPVSRARGGTSRMRSRNVRDDEPSVASAQHELVTCSG